MRSYNNVAISQQERALAKQKMARVGATLPRDEGGLPPIPVTLLRDVAERGPVGALHKAFGEGRTGEVNYLGKLGAYGWEQIGEALPDIPGSTVANMPKHALVDFGKTSSEIVTPAGAVLAAGAGMIPGAAKIILKKAGKTGLAIPEKATKTALDNPAVLKEDFLGGGARVAELGRKFKGAMEDLRLKLSKAYDDLFKKPDPGKVPVKGVKAELKATKGKLKIGEQGIAEIEKESATRFLDAERQIAEEVDQRAMLNWFKTQAKKRRNLTDEELAVAHRNVTAKDIHAIRRKIGAEIKNAPDGYYKKEMTKLKSKYDGFIRDAYPEVKLQDVEYAKYSAAKKTLKRQTGIEPGKEITDKEEAKLATTAKNLFGRNREASERGMRFVTDVLKRPDLSKGLEEIAAAHNFDTAKDALIQVFGFGINPRKIAKETFRSAVGAASNLKRYKGIFQYVGQEANR